MKPQYLYAYCQLILHGYSVAEAQKIIQEIKENMKNDDSNALKRK